MQTALSGALGEESADGKPQFVNADVGPRSQRRGHASVSKTKGSIEGENAIVATGYPKRELGLTCLAQEVEALLDERMADATASELRTHPHSTQKGGFRRRRALHEDHANRLNRGDRDEDRAIRKFRSIDSASRPVCTTRSLQRLAERTWRFLQRRESDASEEIGVLGTESSNHDTITNFYFPCHH